MKCGRLKTAILISTWASLFAAHAQQVYAATGTVTVKARDSHEGDGLSARLFILEPLTATIEDPPEVILNARTRPVSIRPIPRGGTAFELEEGTYIFEAQSGGKRRVRTYFHVQPLGVLPIVFWMDPRHRSKEIEEARFSAGLSGSATFHGHVFDSRTGQALPGASVRLERTGVQTHADDQGYFSVQLRVPSLPDPASPAMDNLLIEFPGLPPQRRSVLISEGQTHWIIDMEETEEHVPDDPSTLISSDITEDLVNQALPLLQDLGFDEDVPFPWRDGVRQHPPLRVWNPPDSLRVGTDCDGTFCRGDVDVVSLETYVKRGLDNEWATPPIRGYHALRSGAVAFRGYGAYYFYNPLRKNKYDICSSAQCQRYDLKTTPEHDAAVDATAGILLQKNGAIIQAEHSLENNNLANPVPDRCANSDLGCGDGSAGSEAKGWPCLADPVCKGKSQPDPTEYYCYGHGRGMCQQGTDRWDLRRGKLWNWIVDHYYNDHYNLNGSGWANRMAVMTSPIGITSVRPVPSRVRPGGSFDIRVNSTNHSQTVHDQVIVTASLFSESTGYIIDPAHDRKLRLSPGSGNQDARRFDVPPGTPNGNYDLIVSFWLDVDQDGVAVAPPIDYEGRYDQPLVSLTLPDAVRVDSPPIPPFIYYRFSQGDLFGRTVRNWGPRQLDGTLAGTFLVVPGVSGNAIQLDGGTAYVEVNNSRDLAFQRGVEVEAFVWRWANVDEDAVASKWYGAEDQWLLTFYPVGNGLLIFSVRLQNGSYAAVEYPIPNRSYLQTWVHVGARYVPGQGLRLFWNGRLAAQRPVPPIAVVSGSQPVHIGDAGPGTIWSRFRGRIDEVRIRVPGGR